MHLISYHLDLTVTNCLWQQMAFLARFIFLVFDLGYYVSILYHSKHLTLLVICYSICIEPVIFLMTIRLYLDTHHLFFMQENEIFLRVP